MLDFQPSIDINVAIQHLKAHLEQHQAIVKQAQVGYRDECLRAITRAYDDIIQRTHAINQGLKPDLSTIWFNVPTPLDFSAEYRTAILMLETQRDSDPYKDTVYITLSKADIQRIFEDQWSWTELFLKTNSRYSQLAKDLLP